MAKAGARLESTHYLLLLVARAGQGAEVARPLLERDRRQLARLSLIRVRLEKRRYGDHFHFICIYCTIHFPYTVIFAYLIAKTWYV